MPMLRIAVASDLHCHPKGAKPSASFLTSDGDRLPSAHHPLASLLELIKRESISADVLAVPGDLTDKMSEQGLHSAFSMVGEIAAALGVNQQRVCITLGNHDVDSRKALTADPFHTVQALNADFPHRSVDCQKSFWQDGFYAIEENGYRIVIINSVSKHFDETLARRGSIEESQLTGLRTYLEQAGPKEIQVGVVHHHPIAHENVGLGADDLMVGGSLLLELLDASGFYLVIHGHKHHPRLKYSGNGAAGLTVFAAGSLSAYSPAVLSNTRNLFHLVEIDSEHPKGCDKAGIIKSWAYNHGKGWSSSSLGGADFPSTAGFGCRMTPEALCDESAQIVRAAGDWPLEWSVFCNRLPAALHAIPSDYRDFRDLLRKKYGISILDIEGHPSHIGVLTKSEQSE